MLLDPRNGPAFDLPPAEHRRSWVVASTPRTGSTLLCRLVWDAGGLGAPKEYLGPMQRRDWAVRFGRPGLAAGLSGPVLPAAVWLPSPLDQVVPRRTSASGWFGMKVHAHHARKAFGPSLDAVPDVLGPVRWVHIVREDRVGQAISWVRAMQTGRWASHQRGHGRARYSRRRLDRALRRIDEHERWWTAHLPPDTLRLRYEDLIADPLGQVEAVFAHLGQRAQARPRIDMARQRDGVTDVWRARYASTIGG